MTKREKIKFIWDKLHEKKTLKTVLVAELLLIVLICSYFSLFQSKIAHVITFFILATMYYFVNKHMKEKYPALTQNNTTEAEK